MAMGPKVTGGPLAWPYAKMDFGSTSGWREVMRDRVEDLKADFLKGLYDNTAFEGISLIKKTAVQPRCLLTKAFRVRWQVGSSSRCGRRTRSSRSTAFSAVG